MEMLNSLTYGLGADLGKKIRLSFYEKEKVLAKHDLYKEFNASQKQLYKDLLALSVFHQYAIGPLHGSVEFMKNTKKYGVKSINMGSYKFDDKMRKTSLGITKGFFEILEKYQINIAQLNAGSINEFIENNLQYVIKVTSEQ